MKKKVIESKFSMFINSLDGTNFFVKRREPTLDDVYFAYEEEEVSWYSVTYRVVSLDGDISFNCNDYYLRIYFEDYDENSNKCRHPKRYFNRPFPNLLEFWVCPDCKEEIK